MTETLYVIAAIALMTAFTLGGIVRIERREKEREAMRARRSLPPHTFAIPTSQLQPGTKEAPRG